MIDDIDMTEIIDDIDIEEILSLQYTQKEPNLNNHQYMLIDMIRLKRENILLKKRVKLLETLSHNQNKNKLLDINSCINSIQHKKSFLESMGVTFETNNVTLYTIDNIRKKDKKKNKRKINLN